MDLWIRSQDKKLLIKANDINIKKSNAGFNSLHDIEVNGVKVGCYANEFIAINILNDIQNRLYTRIMVNEYTGENADLLYSEETQLKAIPDTTLWVKPININTNIYEMPKE